MGNHTTRRHPARWALLAVPAVCLALAGCGGGSGSAGKLLQQTFSGVHKVKSGQLSVSISVQPSPSAALKTPLSLSFGGPFQSLGTGKLPQSNFALSISALGRSIAFGILSTGTSGYVSFQGTSYPLPQSEFQKLESSFASVASSPGGGHSSGILGKLGIQPLTWLRSPRVVGDETVGGTLTTHIRAANQRLGAAARLQPVPGAGFLAGRLGRGELSPWALAEHDRPGCRRDQQSELRRVDWEVR